MRCGKCGGECASGRVCEVCLVQRWTFKGWRPGQVVAIADQVAFIVGQSAEYPESLDVRWVDAIGGSVTMAYSDEALRENGNVPGFDRLGVPGVQRMRARNPLQEDIATVRRGVALNG